MLASLLSWCQILDGGMETRCLHAAVKGLAPRDEGDEHRRYMQRRAAQLVTDSLVVASMVWGSGHGAGASCAGYTDYMDSHDGDFAY